MKEKSKVYLGDVDKEQIVEQFIKDNDIKKVFIVGDDIECTNKKECITYKESILYKYFYPFLQQIDNDALLILNNILKTQNRYCLEYNCIRHYCENTQNIIVFNYYPIIKQAKDFSILYDMIQQNPFYKEKYEYITEFENVVAGEINTSYTKQDIMLDEKFFEKYELEKEKAIQAVKKDADIIPRRLLKLSEKESRKQIKEFDKLTERKPNAHYVVNNSKVDKYYFSEFLRWREEIEDVKSKIQQ